VIDPVAVPYSVPLVGSVTLVAPVVVRVSELAPDVTRLPASVSVFDPLFTPVPPLALGRIPVTLVVRSMVAFVMSALVMSELERTPDALL
jgi:hypothetical protein